jgi:DNA-binding transcriptional ArsR family regulator
MHHLTEPMTAQELTETCKMPQSTIYRKLHRLSEAGLVKELPSLHPSDSGANQYAIAFEQLTIERSETEGFEVELTRRERSAEERLAEMWSQMGEET